MEGDKFRAQKVEEFGLNLQYFSLSVPLNRKPALSAILISRLYGSDVATLIKIF